MTRSAGARARLVPFVIVFAVGAWLGAGAPPEARAQETERLGADRQPYALTISGGVSLGAYEAGLNWVILKALRVEQEAGRIPTPELVGVTGASAGSINALISALSWCLEGDGIGTVNENRFRDIWIPIGFETLLPSSGHGYLDDDGWLTRRAFDRIIGEIETLMAQGKFRTGCSVLLGFTITRPDPAPMSLQGLRITQQRVVMPLELSIENGRPIFRPMIVKKRAELLGNTLYLAPRDQQGSIDYRVVIDAVLASSAFPLAFGRKTLAECVPVPAGQREEDACPSSRPSNTGACEYVSQRLGQKTIACEDDFIDGGVFDNIPLGVAVAQIESSERVRDAARPVSYLYLEPDNRRLPPRATERGSPEPPATVGANLTFLGGAIKTARYYELHNVLRYNAWNQHTDQLGHDAADLLWSLLSDPAIRAPDLSQPDDLLHLRTAVSELEAFVASRRSYGAELPACTDPGRPLAPGFSWSFDTPVAGTELLMRAMPCATAVLDARPNDAELRRGYARVSSRALTAMAGRFRVARLRAPRSQVESTLAFEPYRRFLLDEIARLDALAAALVLSSDKIDPLAARIRAAAISMQGHAPLGAYVRDASQVLAGLQTLLRRENGEDAPPGGLPSWAVAPTGSIPGKAPAPGSADVLRAAAAEVAARHRCAAMLVATTRDLAALAVRPRNEDAGATLDRIQRIRASAASALGAVECLDQAPGVVPPVPAPPNASPVTPPASRTVQALAAARDIAQRSSAIVAPHRAALRDLAALESIERELGLLDRAQELAAQAGRKRLDVHEDRALMLSTRFAPLASSYFSAFTGFLDEPLRRHDYLVGVYDGLYGLAEQVCRGHGVPEPVNSDSTIVNDWTICMRKQIAALAASLDIREPVVDVLKRLEHVPGEIRGDPLKGSGNVGIVLNALVDPRRCSEGGTSAGGPCLLDSDFGAFVAGLERRGYTTRSPYMQRALDNPDFWWVTPAMHALRRMKLIEAGTSSGGWKSASALAQRTLMPLEDRMGGPWTVPSVLPPRFGWGQPWFRLSMTADWIIAGQDEKEGRYRLRPLGFATAGGRLALYGDVGLRVGEEPTAEDGLVPEAGLAFAWRNTGAQYWLVSGLELAGHGALVGERRLRLDASGILLTHLRLGAGYDFDTTTPYGFIGIDDPIGLAYSVASIWF